MRNKISNPLSRLLLVLAVFLFAGSASAEMRTLFTTPEERQIINANRYKTDEPKPVSEVVIEDEEEA